jgi:transcriptional regulator with XRE-family HTH domain
MLILLWRVKRVALGLRQRDVADHAGISQARYSQLERGEDLPNEAEQRAIDRALELPSEVARVVVEAGRHSTELEAGDSLSGEINT